MIELEALNWSFQILLYIYNMISGMSRADVKNVLLIMHAANKKEGHRLRRGGPLFCLLFVRSRGKIMLKVISVKMYSVLLEVQYVYRP